jgi:thymidylate synthase
MIGHPLWFDMSYPILTYAFRKISYNFMFAEAAWILTGDNRLWPLLKTAPSMRKFSDDGIYMSGAYGPKIVDQLPWVINKLIEDCDTRQAVINIWRERPGPSKDIPCTISVQFLIRHGKIHTVVTMRSSDIWLGLPYDVFTFTMLTYLVAVEVQRRTKQPLELGTMYHTAGSRHLYINNACTIPINDPMPTPRIVLPHCDTTVFIAEALCLRAELGWLELNNDDLKLIPWINYGLSNAG